LEALSDSGVERADDFLVGRLLGSVRVAPYEVDSASVRKDCPEDRLRLGIESKKGRGGRIFSNARLGA
jgi:hypothetical protein